MNPPIKAVWRFERIYLEITNVCNKSCDFCPGCSRKADFLSLDDFTFYTRVLRDYTDCLCFHVMGEPTLHPELDAFLSLTDEQNFRVILTTNGSLLKEKGPLLLSHRSLYKIQISLHGCLSDGQALSDCFAAAGAFAGQGIITVLRLWNKGSEGETENARALAMLKQRFDGFWQENQRGFCIDKKLYLEYDEHFVWPSEQGEVLRAGGTCHALKRQIAVLVNGDVVPCCLDGQGKMVLGNLKKQTLGEILSSPLAQDMKKGFAKRELFHPLCRTCGYARRFD